MNVPASVFDLGRMRHLDLLALWCRFHPGHDTAYLIARLSKERLAAAILTGA